MQTINYRSGCVEREAKRTRPFPFAEPPFWGCRRRHADMRIGLIGGSLRLAAPQERAGNFALCFPVG
jgi:hypothetical protein